MGQGPNPEPPALSPSLARWGAPPAPHLLSPRLPAPHRQGASRPLSASDQGPQKAVRLAGAGCRVGTGPRRDPSAAAEGPPDVCRRNEQFRIRNDSGIQNDVSSQMNSKINTAGRALPVPASARSQLATVLPVINRSPHFSYPNAQLVIFNSQEICPPAVDTVRNYSLELTEARTGPCRRALAGPRVGNGAQWPPLTSV